MNISKYIAFAAVAAAASGAFAGDAANVSISFSTPKGEYDYYADGVTKVADGEWYACCWSKDGVFDGITPEMGPLDPNDKVLLMAPLAENGRCDLADFQIDSSVVRNLNGGKYCVIVLDTRDSSGNPAEAKDGKPEHVNMAMASASYTASGTGGSVVTKTEVANAGWDAAIVQPENPAKIVGIEVKGADIVITVDGAMEGVRYNLKSGDTPTTVETYETPVTATETKGQEIPVKKGEGDAKFYKLTHEPLAR